MKTRHYKAKVTRDVHVSITDEEGTFTEADFLQCAIDTLMNGDGTEDGEAHYHSMVLEREINDE